MALWYIKTKLHYADMIAKLSSGNLPEWVVAWRLLSPSAEALWADGEQDEYEYDKNNIFCVYRVYRRFCFELFDPMSYTYTICSKESIFIFANAVNFPMRDQ